LRRLVLASAILLACSATAVSASVNLPGGASTVHVPNTAPRVVHAPHIALGGELLRYEEDTWHWQRVMGIAPTKTAGRSLAAASVSSELVIVGLWRMRAEAAEKLAKHPPHLQQWLCIHHYEGSWTDPNGPYYGGLQMDVTFQQSYGAWLFRHKGTADHWTPLEQMWVAEKALKSRGFWPWPNTARDCGLL